MEGSADPTIIGFLNTTPGHLLINLPFNPPPK
jgi:hypothetical protein